MSNLLIFICEVIGSTMCEVCRRPIAEHRCGHDVAWPIERCKQPTCDRKPPAFNKLKRPVKDVCETCRTKTRAPGGLPGCKEKATKQQPNLDSQFVQQSRNDPGPICETSCQDQNDLRPAGFTIDSNNWTSSSSSPSVTPFTGVENLQP